MNTCTGQGVSIDLTECQLIAQKRLLASWAGSIDLTDLPDVGAAEFLTALIDEQRQHYQQLPNDEERLAYQAARREQTKQLIGEHNINMHFHYQTI